MINSIGRLGNISNQKQDQQGKNKKMKKSNEYKKSFSEMLDSASSIPKK